ncbi:hypothetical protein EF912_11430 [Streptomyces sp. WAC07061]|nr:hypothetical protein EF912_11430 [Streptomyces sp. WAC07061]
MPTRLPVCGPGCRGAVSPRTGSEKSGGFPSVPSSFRFGPACQGRSFVASLRDRLRRPLTDRPAPESRKTAGKPPKKRHGPRWRDGSLSDETRGRAPARRASGPSGVVIPSRGATTRTRG